MRANVRLAQNFKTVIFANVVVKRTLSASAASAQTAQTLPNQQQKLASGIIASPLGPCKKIPSENLVEYIWKKAITWSDKPAAVS